MRPIFVNVDLRTLRLPPTRVNGADPIKLVRQIARHGSSLQGMPPPPVMRGKDGELMLTDGVTRATRAAKLVPGQTIVVEIFDDDPSHDYSWLPRVGDRLP